MAATRATRPEAPAPPASNAVRCAARHPLWSGRHDLSAARARRNDRSPRPNGTGRPHELHRLEAHMNTPSSCGSEDQFVLARATSGMSVVVAATSLGSTLARARPPNTQLATHLIGGVLAGLNRRQSVRLKRWSKNALRSVPGETQLPTGGQSAVVYSSIRAEATTRPAR
jgi:hypothetical protein